MAQYDNCNIDRKYFIIYHASLLKQAFQFAIWFYYQEKYGRLIAAEFRRRVEMENRDTCKYNGHIPREFSLHAKERVAYQSNHHTSLKADDSEHERQHFENVLKVHITHVPPQQLRAEFHETYPKIRQRKKVSRAK
ncbi:MAG: hypothetical protein NTX44_11265 [Ignavibacteriales bacterium]|nr:hypothetical protein [Ignavibacteriales bacterium]